MNQQFKNTKIGEIPIDWEAVKLNDVCDVRDGTHDSPKYIEDGIPFITSKNLTNNGLDFSKTKYISEKDYLKFSTRSNAEMGDILFGMIGTIGNPIIINTNAKFSIKNVALLKLKLATNLNGTFTLNVLKTKLVNKQFYQASNGGVLNLRANAPKFKYLSKKNFFKILII
jgi:type I restriction enzyme S subunit